MEEEEEEEEEFILRMRSVSCLMICDVCSIGKVSGVREGLVGGVSKIDRFSANVIFWRPLWDQPGRWKYRKVDPPPATTTDVYWYTIHVSSSASIHRQF
jgi:hypothetical protein